MSIVEDPIQDSSKIFENDICRLNEINNSFQSNNATINFHDANNRELPFNNEDDFNDRENEGLGLVMDVRSTTFRNLNEMIPRGYGDITSLTKKEEESVASEHSNLDVTGSSSPSNDPLEEMKIRNQEKWAQVGYDPKAGRGNMKMSITLSNFKPSSIIQQSNPSDLKSNDVNKNSSINQNQQSLLDSLPENNENINSPYSALVLQSYSMCLNPNKQVKRANSSNDPSVFIKAESNSDENEEDQNVSSSEDEPIPAANLNTAALLASFQPLEEDLQNPDHSSELNTFDCAQHNSGSNIEDSEPNNSSYEYASNFFSDHHASESNSIIINENSDLNGMTSSNENMVVPKSPKSLDSSFTSGEGKSSSKECSKNDQSTITSKSGKASKSQNQCGYNYSAYDDPNFDFTAASKDVPPDLLKFIQYPKTGIIFRAICGQSMSQYPKGVAQYVIADLKTILDKCISKNMVTESIYMTSIIDTIKTEIGSNKNIKKSKFDEERCMNAEESLSKRRQYWANQMAILNSEKEVKLQEIEIRYQDELENLEMKWNSDRKRSQFNKPSAKLIALKQSIQINLASKRFQEAAQLASKAEKLDKSETELAAQRMRQAYSSTVERLKQKFEHEKEAVIQSFEAKRCSLLAQEEAESRSFEDGSQKCDNQQQQPNQIDASSGHPAASSVARRKSISVMSKTPGNYGPIIKKPLIKAPKVSAQTKLSMLKPNA